MAQQRDLDFEARVLIDAVFDGDSEAARKHGIVRQTITRYRAAMASDDDLRARFRALLQPIDDKIISERIALELKGLAAGTAIANKILEIVPDCKPSQLPALAAAFVQISEGIRNVGELSLAAKVLGVGSNDRQPDAGAAEADRDPEGAAN